MGRSLEAYWEKGSPTAMASTLYKGALASLRRRGGGMRVVTGGKIRLLESLYSLKSCKMLPPIAKRTVTEPFSPNAQGGPDVPPPRRTPPTGAHPLLLTSHPLVTFQTW